MQFTGAAADRAVQIIAFDVAEGVAVEVDVVQMAAAVIQIVEGFATRQNGLNAVAEYVVAVFGDFFALGITRLQNVEADRFA